MKRSSLGILLLAALACDAGGPTQLEATTVTLTLANPVGVERPDSLRLAVVWRTAETSTTPWFPTFDHGLSDREVSHPVRVELPGEVALSELTDSVSILVAPADSTDPSWPEGCAELSQLSFPGVRPLWVVYQDLNENGRLDGAPLDRVWGITDFSSKHLTAFADFEKALSQVSLEGSECLRQVTGGSFSPFASGQLSGTYFYVSREPASEFTLSLNPTSYPGAFLTCGSSLQSSLEQSETLLSIAPELVPEACTDDENPCTRLPYESDWDGATQALSLPGFYRWAGCVTVGDLEVLWTREEQLECDGCACITHDQDHGWVVSRTARPQDWPCGDSVQICDATSDLVEVIPTDCLLW